MAKEYIDIELALALCEDKRWRLHDINDLGGWSVVTELQADIRSLPAADVRENVRGRWIYLRSRGWSYCSVCKTEPAPPVFQSRNFCPNCGAQMGGAEDGK